MDSNSILKNSLDLVEENKRLNQWIELFKRHPEQINSPHGSDAELIPIAEGANLLAASTDTICEEISFGLYQEPYTIGWITVMANLSDLAAVGAYPIGLLISVSWPKDTTQNFKREIAHGIQEACEKIGTYLIGGDTNETPIISLTGCALGVLKKDDMVTRIGLKPGDFIYISYPAGLGNLMAASKYLNISDRLFAEREYRPTARIREGQILAPFASSCIDTSDGVFSALDQLVRLNQVGIEIEAHWKELVFPASNQFDSVPFSALLAGYHGEYELLFSIPQNVNEIFLIKAKSIGWNPLFLGKAIDDPVVSFRNIPIDTLYFRNLIEEVNYDVDKYISLLMQACHNIERIGD
jgi:thiamine-monophosphate kinase